MGLSGIFFSLAFDEWKGRGHGRRWWDYARIALVPTDASAETLHSKPLSFKPSTLARYV